MKYLPFAGGVAIALGLWVRPAAQRGDRVSADSTTYTLRGNVQGLTTGWVLLYHPGDEPTDSAAIRDGHFELTGAAAGPELCHLVFQKANRDNLRSVGFFLQPGSIQVTGTREALEALRFTGAPLQDEYEQFQQTLRKTADWQVQREMVRRYAADHPGSFVAVEEVLEYFSFNPDADTLRTIYDGLAPEIGTSRMGKELKGIMDAALLTGIGRPAPEFSQTDAKGKPVALTSFKGEYVLIDFWASWCGPCRQENPNVLKTYRKYHAKGFTVLGVSLDDRKDQWLHAVSMDGLPWTQLSDLKGWKNEVAVLYGVEGIPMNFLLDKDGRIVAKGLRGEDLNKKLAEVLHQ